ncbi:MAG: lysophospholipase [Eubacteriaceae bacterium]|nr:lysophospholipase [Eubacteriaceae bacterium]
MKEVLSLNIGGETIYAEKHAVEGAKAVITVIHGLGEHIGRYAYFIGKLNESGYTVYGLDLYGHGQSGGMRGYLDDFQRFVDEAIYLVNYAKAENPDKKHFLFGHSMGGCIVSTVGEQTDGLVDGIILSGACTDVPPSAAKLQGAIKVLSKIAPKAKLGNSLGEFVSRDKDVVEYYNTDPLNLKKLTFSLYNQFCVIGANNSRDNAGKFSYPVIILHGSEDKLSDPQASVNFYNNISSSDKSLKMYEGLYHEILNEPEKDEVISDILAWLEERVK